MFNNPCRLPWQIQKLVEICRGIFSKEKCTKMWKNWTDTLLFNLPYDYTGRGAQISFAKPFKKLPKTSSILR